MKKKLSKILSLMMIFAVAFSMIIIPQTSVVKADEIGTLLEYSKSMTLATGTYTIDFGKKFNNEKDKIKVTTSDKRVAAVEKDFPTIELKKKGTAKIKFTVTKKNGKKKTYKMTVKVFKYKNPFKSIKLGSEQYRSKFKKNQGFEIEKKEGKYKISVKPAKGWTVQKIVHAWYDTDKNGELDFDKLIEKKVKNNKKISVKEESLISWLTVYMYNKKTGVTEMMEFSIYCGEI